MQRGLCIRSSIALQSTHFINLSLGSVSYLSSSASIMSKPLILVSGATGAQGKPVAKALASMGYPVRGLSRNPDSEKAKGAAIDGVVMAKASLQNKAELKAAFAGVERAFLVTQFWEKLDVGDEILQVRVA